MTKSKPNKSLFGLVQIGFFGYGFFALAYLVLSFSLTFSKFEKDQFSILCVPLDDSYSLLIETHKGRNEQKIRYLIEHESCE